MSDEGTLNATVPIFRRREGTSWSESEGRGLAHLYTRGIDIEAENAEGAALRSHDRIANSMGRRDVRTGLDSLEGLVGAGVVDPVEQKTSTIERKLCLGWTCSVFCQTQLPHCEMTMPIAVYQRLERQSGTITTALAIVRTFSLCYFIHGDVSIP